MLFIKEMKDFIHSIRRKERNVLHMYVFNEDHYLVPKCFVHKTISFIVFVSIIFLQQTFIYFVRILPENTLEISDIEVVCLWNATLCNTSLSRA